MRHKIVLMEGGTETLEYFSHQLQKGFEMLGYDTFMFDQTREEDSAALLYKFADADDTILVTFNFDGIHYETSLFNVNGVSIWNERHIPCVNIAVDHPYFYPELLDIHPDIFYEVSIDRYHDKYMAKFYPTLNRGPFLPLGGTALYPDGSFPSVNARMYDLSFTGNYTPPEEFDQYIERLGDEYTKFYHDILDDLLADPDQPDDLVMERHLRDAIPDITTADLKKVIPDMIFIDTYIRCYFRGEVVKSIIDSGLKLHCIGKGWQKLKCSHPDNLTFEPDLLSHDCLQTLTQSKLSLNVMPWFKDGAHDRIFNSMLNGAVCLTDHSIYLDEVLSDNENIIFYDLKHLSELPDIIKNSLSDTTHLVNIQKNAFELATKNHSWLIRAKTLHDKLLKFL